LHLFDFSAFGGFSLGGIEVLIFFCEICA